ncbi:MAG: hypothetical protein ACD_42C00543G0001, partial [uncultured bacterium]
SATAFVPTITRPGFVGDPDQFGQEPGGVGKQCGVNKVVLMYKPNPASCTPKNLELARQTGVTAEELMCQGCSCPALKMAGYTIGDLKNIGMTAEQLHQCGYSLQDLMNAGFSASDLKQAGFSAQDLKNAGFSAGELKAAGFDAADLKKAGFTNAQILNAGYEKTTSAACDVATLTKEREAGKSAADLKNQGCDVAALKAAGFTAAQLKQAGFSANDLKTAGFSDADLSAAGFSPTEIKAADAAVGNCSVEKLKKEREAGASATALRQQGCGLAALKAAGFSAADLRAAGFSAGQLKAAGFSATELKDAGFSAGDLKSAGFSAADLKNAGYSATELKNAGFNPAELKDAGFSAADLKNAGYSATDLRTAGFTPGQLASAGYSASELRAAGFSAKELRHAGLSAADLREAGYSSNELKAAGFTKGDLLRAGYAAGEAGYAATAAAPADTEAAMSAPAGTSLPSITGNTPEARLADFEKKQQQDMSEQQRRDHIQRLQNFMNQQAEKLLVGWSHVDMQQTQKTPPEKPASEKEGAGGGVGNHGHGSGGIAAQGGSVIKAGTVLFAVIDTSINSDENTPIMARIVTGELNGSKLLGSFSRRHKRLLITFNLLNDPRYEKSISLSAVAIDPDTARTAISGQVNNHYLLRYGTLFASAFLEGVATGIQNQGVTSNCLVAGFGCTVQQTALTSRQQVLVGLGKVGSAYAQNMGQNFNRAPTIRIPGGTGIGVLVMSDLTMPAK